LFYIFVTRTLSPTGERGIRGANLLPRTAVTVGSRGLARRDDLHNPPFDPLFLFAAPLETERINRPPELELGLSPVDLRLELQEVKLEFGVCRPAVTRGVRNIPDVPLTLGSGRKEDQIAAFQQKDAVLAIFPDDPA